MVNKTVRDEIIKAITNEDTSKFENRGDTWCKYESGNGWTIWKRRGKSAHTFFLNSGRYQVGSIEHAQTLDGDLCISLKYCDVKVILKADK